MENKSRTWLIAVGLLVLLSSAGLGYAAVSQFSVGSGTAFGVSGGPEISVEPTTSIDSGNPVRSSTLVNISDVEFESSGDTEATVSKFQGTYLNLTDIDVSATNLSVRDPGKQRVEIGGDVDKFNFSDMSVDDNSPDFVFEGSTGETTVEIDGVPSSTQITAADEQQDEILDVSTSDGSGTVSFRMDNSQHTVFLRTSSGGPTLSNGRPAGDLDSAVTEFKIDVKDPDLPQDNISVELDVDGSPNGSTFISSNGTATIDVSNQDYVGGQHTATVTATDAYGQSTSTSWTFKVPDQLTIRNETTPSEIIKPATVEVEFFFESGGQITSVSRTTSDGNVSLTELPVDRPIVASAEAQGFRNRRIFISSIYEQQDLYLLSDSRQSVEVTFNLQDFSGDFPQDTTVLVVERPIDGNFTNILGDFFGANGQFPATLHFNERHRLMLLNTETGETRDLGSFTPLSSGKQELAVSVSGQVEPQNVDASLSQKPIAELLPAEELDLAITLRNGSTSISQYDVAIYKINSSSNETLASTSRTSSGTITETINLTGADSDATVKVVSVYSSSNGAQQRRVKSYGVVKSSKGTPTILGELTDLVGLVPSENQDSFSLALALIGTIVGTASVASRFRISSETSGIVALAFLTAFGIVGFISFELLFVGTVAFGSFAFLRRVL